MADPFNTTNLLTKAPFIVLGATSLALAGIALIIDARYYGGMGHDPILAALGIVIDIIAIITPCVIGRTPRFGARLVGWLIWSGAVAMTLLATSGWSSQNIGDAVTARVIEATRTDELLERLKALQGQRKAIAEVRSLKVIQTAMHDRCDKACRHQLKTAQATAQQRDELDAQIRDLDGKLTSAKGISSPDTGAAIVATWLHVEPTQVAGARILGLTVLPATAGLLLSLAWCGSSHRSERLVPSPLAAGPGSSTRGFLLGVPQAAGADCDFLQNAPVLSKSYPGAGGRRERPFAMET